MSFHLINPWDDPVTQDRLDIVFEHRFRDYGAYYVRRHYNRNKFIAMLLSGFLAVFITYSMKWPGNSLPPPKIKSWSPPNGPNDSLGPVPEDPPEQQPSGSGSSKASANPADLVPNIDLNAPDILKFNRNMGGQGDGEGPGYFPGKDGLPDFGQENPSGNGKKPNSGGMNRICQFPGGDEAFVQFVQDHFQAPATCMESFTGAWVSVLFKIDSRGNLKEVRILESNLSCPDFIAESQRILLSSPKWISAVENGHPISCVRKMKLQLVFL